MIDIYMAIYVGILFILLTPDVLVCIPKRSSSLTSAIVHGILFAVIYYFTYKIVFDMVKGNVKEGYGEVRPPPKRK